jgi:hypothetical protein
MEMGKRSDVEAKKDFGDTEEDGDMEMEAKI